MGKGHPQTTETKIKISQSLKGRKPKNLEYLHSLKMTDEWKKKIGLANSIALKGNIPWNKGKRYSMSKPKKRTIRICKNCNQEFEIETWRLKDKTRGTFCSHRCFSKFYSGNNHKWYGRNMSDENNPSWKGNNVGYYGLHLWVNKYLGQPTKCEFCGKNGLNGRQIHWANKDHQYKRNLEDWLRLCMLCHKQYDLEREVDQL